MAVYTLFTRISITYDNFILKTTKQSNLKHVTYMEEVCRINMQLTWFSNVILFKFKKTEFILSHKVIFYLTKEPDELCIGKTLKEIDDGKRTCSCWVNCEETQYEVKLSSSDWPSQDFVVKKLYQNNIVVTKRIF